IMAFLDAKPPLLQRLCCCVAAGPQRRAWTMFGTPLRRPRTPLGRSNMRELLSLATVGVGEVMLSFIQYRLAGGKQRANSLSALRLIIVPYLFHKAEMTTM
ncbi:hypothetical protein, partial [Aeromonas caviae]|uniref:hypothetical protein n=1 Tax=Aeromonas caviae TaxID=648 RepID=UPI0029DE7527